MESKFLELPNVSLVCVDCYNVGAAISSMQKSMQKVKFGSAILFTDKEVEVNGISVVKIRPIRSKDEYSYFMMKVLAQFIKLDYILVVQHDSWILNVDSWDNKFLDYDYIGASWIFGKGERNVGNGGFSLRTKKLCKILATDDFIISTEQEDLQIGRTYAEYLEKKHKIKFAGEKLADKFAFELREPVQHTFGFHSYFHEPFKDHVVIKRTAAMGDLIMAEPIITYYAEKGYQVVIDTLIEFMPLFMNSPYKVKHISQMNTAIVPKLVINLDMAYESKPQELVLKTYYEFANIKDGEIRNSRLNFNLPNNQKLFSKYVLLHIDDTGLAHRNTYGVEWNLVISYLHRLGYIVFQIGKRTTNVVAPHLNAATKEMLMFAVKGADLLIGIDSGIAQIAVALNIPSIILFGSVNPKLRYANFEKIGAIQGNCISEEDKNCYHQDITTTGRQCKYNSQMPPCSIHSEFKIIEQINKLLK